MMQVKGTEIAKRQVEVEISPRDVFTSLRGEVFSKLKLPTYDIPYVKNGKIYIDEEEHGHRTTWDTKLIAEVPSEDQLTAIETFQNLIALIQKLEIR
jgi:hypothetical protein